MGGHKCVQCAWRTRRHQGTALQRSPASPPHARRHITAKARPNFRYRHSDKTRACLRFAKIYSRAGVLLPPCTQRTKCRIALRRTTHPPQAVPLPLQGKAYLKSNTAAPSFIMRRASKLLPLLDMKPRILAVVPVARRRITSSLGIVFLQMVSPILKVQPPL